MNKAVGSTSTKFNPMVTCRASLLILYEWSTCTLL